MYVTSKFSKMWGRKILNGRGKDSGWKETGDHQENLDINLIMQEKRKWPDDLHVFYCEALYHNMLSLSTEFSRHENERI